MDNFKKICTKDLQFLVYYYSKSILNIKLMKKNALSASTIFFVTKTKSRRTSPTNQHILNVRFFYSILSTA